MDEKKKITLSILLVLLLFLAYGKLSWNKTFTEDQLDNFLESIKNEKSLSFFPKIKQSLKDHGCLKIEVTGKYNRSVSYSIRDVSNSLHCQKPVIIKMNDHSISGIIYGSYNLNGAIFSEITTGNLRIEGLSIGDLVRSI